MATKTAVRAVRDWMQEKQGQCLCDECVARGTGLNRLAVSRAIQSDTSQFSRYRARCSVCQKVITVTAGRRLVWA